MRAQDAINLEDFRLAAQRRLPRLAFDFIEGGAEDELGMSRNRRAFDRYSLIPRYLVDVSKPSSRTTVFGRSYALPTGISPMGMCGMFRKDADLHLARAAAAVDVPYIMSSASSSTIEEAAAVAPHNTWFQIYGSLKRDITHDMIRRAEAAGISTLVLTVDVPVASKRERNLRNGFTRPLRLSRKAMFDILAHPAWLYGYLRYGGLPVMGNLAPYAKAGATANEVADLFSAQTPASNQTWDDLAVYRRLWKGNLVLKGVMHAEDAVKAKALGVDGLIVSNHGGRQLDRAPSALEMLMPIRRAVGDDMVLMMDGGVRRGSDIVIARGLGAALSFVGRPALCGAVADAAAGATRALQILQSELRTVLAQIGVTDIDTLQSGQILDDVEDAEEPVFGPGAVVRQSGAI